MRGLLQAIGWGIALVLMVTSVLMFIAWNTGWKRRIVSLFETRWGWCLPGGLWWKLGRQQGTLGDKWPLFFGPIPFALYRAGWDHTVNKRARESTPTDLES